MSALAQIKLPYDWSDKITDHEEIRKHFPKFYKDDGEPEKWGIGDIIVDSEEMVLLSNLGVPFTVHRFKGVVPAGVGVPENSQVQIHLPNYVLNNYNRVDLLEDCCTDKLQKALDDGWRIIAVCPPLNARRPDYIVAKYEQ